ncbi:MAG: oligosaccharide flippase family protein [Candidatus Berkelbacteria bacterium]
MTGAFIKIIENLHRRIFRHEMSPTMRAFFGNLSWSMLGYFVGGLISFVVMILAGRILGPNEYGNYNLVLTIGSFLAAFMLFGFDTTSVKYISSSKDPGRKKEAISNTLLLTAITAFVFLVSTLIFSARISHYLNTTQTLVIFGAVAGLVVMCSALTDGFIRSLQKYKFQSIVNILQSVIIFVLFIIFYIILRKSSYQYYAGILIFSTLVVIVIYLISIRDQIVSWSSTMWKKMLPYWKLTLATSLISVVITSIDKFFLSHYLGAAELGLYSAYLLTSSLIIAHLMSAFINVFFPMINNSGNQLAILKKVDRLTLIGFVPAMAIILAITFVVVKLFGSQYPLNFRYLTIVSLIAFMQIVVVSYSSLISSSVKMYKRSVKIYYFKPIVIALLVILLIAKPGLISIYTVFLFSIISYLYDIISARSCFYLAREVL